MAAEDDDSFSRSKFLEAATLGVGGLIGGMVTVPALGFAIWPAFNHQRTHNIDLGALTDFPDGKYVIATFMLDPSEGEISRRTAYVRNNGLAGTVPSFTILSNRCAHLGCPVQPNGPVFDNQKKIAKSKTQDVTLIPSQPAGFGCPCHGGQYDTEGNRIAGPPVRKKRQSMAAASTRNSTVNDSNATMWPAGASWPIPIARSASCAK